MAKKPLFINPPPGISSAGEVHRQLSLDDQIADARRQLALKEGIPFLYGWPWYKWAREFYESHDKICLLTAANQISKSSTQIRKCLNWATDQELWKELWIRKPTQFWYLYPTGGQVAAEWATKWPQFLPSGRYKTDETYGWELIGSEKKPTGIKFNSGVYIFFKTYGQNVAALQTGSCDAIFCDEELPEDLYSELKFRTAATDGYFNMVFTATMGQEFWRLTMEPGEEEDEKFPDAHKQTVSLYDAMFYEDGTPSPWTKARIKRMEDQCPTDNEILKRIHGKFLVSTDDKKYPSFDIKRHIKKAHPIPKHWQTYSAVDLGSGGSNRDSSGRKKVPHFPSICFVAVSPDYRSGRVFKGWLGDDGKKYTAGDVFLKWRELADGLVIVRNFYDWGSSDFGEIARRNGVPFEKAEKGHDIGEQYINTLFKNDMMFIYDEPELAKLPRELARLKKATLKKNAVDNFADSFRYAVTKVPWDWIAITGAGIEPEETLEKPMNDMQRQIAERRKEFDGNQEREQQRIEEEFRECNESYGEGEF